MTYKDDEGKNVTVVMGTYGIGLGRAMGAAVEALSDGVGIIWPESIAPFKVHLVEIMSKNDDSIKKKTEELYDFLKSEGVEVLYDDRDISAGKKLGDADLIGIPYRVLVSEKSLKEGGLELKNRKTGETKIITEKELLALHPME